MMNCKFTRREWAQRILAPAALPAMVRAAAPKVRIGAHIWVYAAKQPNTDASEIIERIFLELGNAGLDGVELMYQVVLSESAYPKLPELMKRHRLPVFGSSWSANTWDRTKHAAIEVEGRRLIERLGKLGSRVLGMSVGDARRKKTPAEFDDQAAMLRKLMAICRDNGMVMNLHNHIYEVKDGEYDLSNTLERIPDVGLGPDLNWLLRAKVDPVDFIRRRGKNIVYAHLRDEKADGTWPEAMGEGTMDYVAIGKALHDVKFKGDMAIELAHEKSFVPTRSYGESFRMSREFVRRTMRY